MPLLLLGSSRSIQNRKAVRRRASTKNVVQWRRNTRSQLFINHSHYGPCDKSCTPRLQFTYRSWVDGGGDGGSTFALIIINVAAAVGAYRKRCISGGSIVCGSSRGIVGINSEIRKSTHAIFYPYFRFKQHHEDFVGGWLSHLQQTRCEWCLPFYLELGVNDIHSNDHSLGDRETGEYFLELFGIIY